MNWFGLEFKHSTLFAAMCILIFFEKHLIGTASSEELAIVMLGYVVCDCIEKRSN